MPATEKEVGITETLGQHRPFRAVLKQQIDDFIVQEVMMNGEVAQINKLPNPPNEKPSKKDLKRAENEQQQDEVDKKRIVVPTDEQLAVLDTYFADSEYRASEIVKDLIEAIKNASSQGLSTRDIDAHFPICSEKSTRKNVHNWVRDYLPNVLSELDSDGAIRLFHAKSVCPSKRRRSDTDQKLTDNVKKEFDQISRDSPIQFKLWKRDRDTNDALEKLAQILRVKPSMFSYAGTKDKRGITTQLIQVRRANPYMFVHVNRAFAPASNRNPGYRFRGMVVGDIEGVHFQSPPLSLGDLRGNRFTIALRDVDIHNENDDKNIRMAVDTLRKRGFVNYFGMQRFGSGASPTHKTGFALMRGDFEDVCRRLLLPLRVGSETMKNETMSNKTNVDGGNGDDRNGSDNVGSNETGGKKRKNNRDNGMRTERRKMVEALEAFGRREIEASQLLDALPRRMFVERKIASSFARDEARQIEQTKNGIPIEYDYQRAFNYLPRNLRLMYAHAVQSYLWNLMASTRIRRYCPDCDDRMHAIAGDLVLENEEDMDDDSINYTTQVRKVTSEEEKNKSVSVFRVVLPVIGSEVDIPESAWGEAARDVLESEQVDMADCYKSEYNLKGTYRHLLALPENLEFQLKSYSNVYEPLMPNGLEDLNIDQYIPQDRRAKSEQKRKQRSDKNGATHNNKETGKTSSSNRENSEDKKEGETNKEDTEKDTDKKDAEKHPSSENANDTSSNVEETNTEIKETTSSEPVQTNVTSQANGNAQKQDDIENNGNKDKNKDDETTSNPKNAIILAFTLRCAQYATMLVRELTKKDSSTAGQKAMQDEVEKPE